MSTILSRTPADQARFLKSLSPEQRARYKVEIRRLFELDDEKAIPSIRARIESVPALVLEVLTDMGYDVKYMDEYDETPVYPGDVSR